MSADVISGTLDDSSWEHPHLMLLCSSTQGQDVPSTECVSATSHKRIAENLALCRHPTYIYINGYLKVLCTLCSSIHKVG